MARTETVTRRRVVVDQRQLAKAIGARIRAARLAANLTQQELAGDRYTKAYISALELGHAKPSMAALDYLAPRLGTTADRLLADQSSRWSRVDADLHLAAGRYREAADAYRDLADRAVDPVVRGELLAGAGDALGKLGLGAEAGVVLAEADTLLQQGGRLIDRVHCRFSLAWVHAFLGDPAEARRILEGILNDPEQMAVEHDLEVRVRILLAGIEADHGSPERAVQYLEEARGRLDGLDIRRRAIFFDTLAMARDQAGDVEAAITAALEAQALFRAADLEMEAAALDNRMAFALIKLGNLTRADELSTRSIDALRRIGHLRMLGHALATRATIRMDQGDAAGALKAADESLEVERADGAGVEQIAARIERARALGALGRREEADAQWAENVRLARETTSHVRRQRVMSAWADDLAAQGRHAEAYEAMKQAL